MIWVTGIFGVLLIAAAIFGLMILQRKISGDDTPLFSGRKRRRNTEDSNELEAFIAAYRSGQVDPQDLLSGESAGEPTLSANFGATGHALPGNFGATGHARPGNIDADGQALARNMGSVAPDAPIAAIAAPSSPAVFLRPAVKLAYLTFRSGLRDHHVFANVRLGDLGHGTAVGKVDLLVCDASFKYVAVVDVYTGEHVEDVPKRMFLRRVGVKHLTLSTSAMPKPAQLRELIYGNENA